MSHPDITEVVLSEEQIKARVAELGAQITKDYKGEPLVVITILRGGAIFATDLVRSIELPLELDFMAVSSYGNGTTSSGRVQILKDLSSSIEGKHVLIAEDILDTGITLSHLMAVLEHRNPLSIEIAALLKKVGTQKVDIDCKYVGFDCPNAFIVGYGLDYAERYRNLPYIGVLDSKVYA